MNKKRALSLAREWAQGHRCTLRDGEAGEYHAMFASMLEAEMLNKPLKPTGCYGCYYLDEQCAPCAYCIRSAGYADYFRRPPGGRSMNENIQALFEMGKIEAPVEKLAREFCRASKMGEFKCAVTTRFGFFCDLCLEDELLHLKSVGVHTVASCCGHGNPELASILTVGENSREAMQNMGYELIGDLYGRDNWRPKSTLLYSTPEGDEST